MKEMEGSITVIGVENAVNAIAFARHSCAAIMLSG